jgi:formylglycine-generating enzyme required for sulfatase activity
MVAIPAGCFEMGSPGGVGDGGEHPQHRVCVSAFSMDKYDVTQGAYRQATGKNPSYFPKCGDNCPVEQVSWHEAKSYCESHGKRLPTEAEWEYAARAGTTTKWYWDDDEGNAGQYAWYSGNSGNTTHPVGQKPPNAWGLYDMAGNVWQWTSDWYGSYSSGEQQNPTGPSSGSSRVLRGGSWYDVPGVLRSAYRYGIDPGGRNDNLGFRCVDP